MSGSADLSHEMLLLALDEELHTSPIVAEKATVLDVGTGTGTWACQLASRHPSARVYGIDLHQVNPERIPSNVIFETVDVMSGFPFNTNTFDFVHSRLLVGGITDWSSYLENLLRITKRGGYVECVELEICPRTPVHVALLQSWTTKMSEYLKQRQLEPSIAERLGKLMEAAGFTAVQDKVVEVPIGSWSEDEKARKIGGLALEYSQVHVVQWFADSLIAQGADKDQVKADSDAVIAVLLDPKFRGSMRWHFCTGRK